LAFIHTVAGLAEDQSRNPTALRDGELLLRRRLARIREWLTVVLPEEQQVHLGAFHPSQAGVPAGDRLSREVLETPRLMTSGVQQAREVVTFIL